MTFLVLFAESLHRNDKNKKNPQGPTAGRLESERFKYVIPFVNCLKHIILVNSEYVTTFTMTIFYCPKVVNIPKHRTQCMHNTPVMKILKVYFYKILMLKVI